jgi:hypothetical protein
LALLRELAPTARREELAWNPWEPLGFERLALAQLQLTRGDLADAHRTASNLDSPQPIIYLLYLPASLALRRAVAESLGVVSRVREYRQRLERLGRTDLLFP